MHFLRRKCPHTPAQTHTDACQPIAHAPWSTARMWPRGYLKVYARVRDSALCSYVACTHHERRATRLLGVPLPDLPPDRQVSWSQNRRHDKFTQHTCRIAPYRPNKSYNYPEAHCMSVCRHGRGATCSPGSARACTDKEHAQGHAKRLGPSDLFGCDFEGQIPHEQNPVHLPCAAAS